MNYWIQKEQRVHLNKMKVMRKEQIKEIEKILIPLRDNLKYIDLVLTGQYPLQSFVKHTEQVNEFVEGVFKDSKQEE